MKYDLNWLLEIYKEEPRVKFLHFWGHQPSRNGQITHTCLSQWWHAPFMIDEVQYPTAEHWMMAEKARLFGNGKLRSKIIGCGSPGEAKALGRVVENFDEATWLEHRHSLVLKGSIEKFSQHAGLCAYLLDTNERILAEASPVDSIWGIGLAADDPRAADPIQWNGLNLLGFTLMETRDVLKNR